MHHDADLWLEFSECDQEVTRTAELCVYFGELKVQLTRGVEPSDDWEEYVDDEPEYWRDTVGMDFASGAELKAFVGALVQALYGTGLSHLVGREELSEDEALDRIGDAVGRLNSEFGVEGREPRDGKAQIDEWVAFG